MIDIIRILTKNQLLLKGRVVIRGVLEFDFVKLVDNKTKEITYNILWLCSVDAKLLDDVC